MSDINRDAAKYGVVNQSVAYPYVRTDSTPGARSPIRPRNTSSCETGYARSPHSADTAGHRQGHERARFDNLAQHGTPAGLAVDGGG